MEMKFIIYAIGGILYFFYKKAQDAKKNAPSAADTADEKPVEQPKPIRPPAYSPFDEVKREMQRKAAAIEAQRKLATQSAQSTERTGNSKPPKDLFIKETKKATFGEGANDAPVYEDEVVESRKLGRTDIRLENEGIYRVETMEEARALADEAAFEQIEFDAKQAFIGSVIFERKY